MLQTGVPDAQHLGGAPVLLLEVLVPAVVAKDGGGGWGGGKRGKKDTIGVVRR